MCSRFLCLVDQSTRSLPVNTHAEKIPQWLVSTTKAATMTLLPLSSSYLAGVISRKQSLFVPPILSTRLPTRIIQPYLRLRAAFTCPSRSAGRTCATPFMVGPISLPRCVHGASCTFGLLRMRLTFPEPGSVATYSLSFSKANQTGVGTGLPFFL